MWGDTACHEHPTAAIKQGLYSVPDTQYRYLSAARTPLVPRPESPEYKYPICSSSFIIQPIISPTSSSQPSKARETYNPPRSRQFSNIRGTRPPFFSVSTFLPLPCSSRPRTNDPSLAGGELYLLPLS